MSYSHESFNQVRVTLIFFLFIYFFLFIFCCVEICNKEITMDTTKPRDDLFPPGESIYIDIWKLLRMFPRFSSIYIFSNKSIFLIANRISRPKKYHFMCQQGRKKKQCLNTDLRAFYGRSVENHFLNCLNLERADLSFFIRE